MVPSEWQKIYWHPSVSQCWDTFCQFTVTGEPPTVMFPVLAENLPVASSKVTVPVPLAPADAVQFQVFVVPDLVKPTVTVRVAISRS